jgi:hypothetical protein
VNAKVCDTRLSSEHAIDVVVNGLPAAAKSSVVRDLCNAEDLILVPTKDLETDWITKTKNMHFKYRPAVMTITKFIDSPPPQTKYRLIVVDEVFLIEVALLAYARNFCQKALGLGDTSQIKGFHTRLAQQSYELRKECIPFYISAPFSLGLPVDVLRLGKKLGFVPPEALTLNTTHALRLITPEEAIPISTHPDTLMIVFNRSELVETQKNRLTAHTSQGQRPKQSLIRATNSEAVWIPGSGHFWVALSRATHRTYLLLDAIPLANFNRYALDVQGTTHKEIRRLESFKQTFNECDATASLRSHSLTHQAIETGLKYDTPIFAEEDDVPSEPAYRIKISADPNILSAAMTSINLNVEGISYADVADTSDLTFKSRCSAAGRMRLDLKAAHGKSSSILNPAGVHFRSDDTITEAFTIIDRYLQLPEFKTERGPDQMADELLEAFFKAFIKQDADFIPLDNNTTFNDWLATRKMNTFQLDGYDFGETRESTEYHSFLKSHAKAKNKMGFGLKLEKGQTIAAGSQSYNARFSGYARQLTNALHQVMKGNAAMDIGMNEKAFEARCKEMGAYSENNTQIDCDSQDSSHREHHVVMLINLLRIFTDITDEDCAIYYHMRKSNTVTARNFGSDQQIKYNISWILPSGDPLTLLANCVHEAASLAYIFCLWLVEYTAFYEKGDDVYVNCILPFGPLEKLRMQEVGISIKIDYNLPPFFAARYILPDNTTAYDPVKIAAKYSVKNFSPDLIEEYLRSYADILRPITPQQFALINLYNLAHHPSLTLDESELLTNFAYSLWDREHFLKYQKPDYHLRYQLFSPKMDCARTVFRALGSKSHQLSASPNANEVMTQAAICHLRYQYHPDQPTAVLEDIARRHPHTIILSNTHATTYAAYERLDIQRPNDTKKKNKRSLQSTFYS